MPLFGIIKEFFLFFLTFKSLNMKGYIYDTARRFYYESENVAEDFNKIKEQSKHTMLFRNVDFVMVEMPLIGNYRKVGREFFIEDKEIEKWPLNVKRGEWDEQFRQSESPCAVFNRTTNEFEVRLPIPVNVASFLKEVGEIYSCYTKNQMYTGAIRRRTNKNNIHTWIYERHFKLNLEKSFQEQSSICLKQVMANTRKLKAMAFEAEAEKILKDL